MSKRTILGIVAVPTMFTVWLMGGRPRPLRASTRRLIREGGLKRLLNLSTVHGYIYSRWINQCVSLAIKAVLPVLQFLGPGQKRWFADRYHGKVLTHELAEAIITNDHHIPLRDLEQIIPYATARFLVLEGSPDIAVYDCACRNARANPCQPTQVCVVVGQPLVDFVLEHHPKTSRRLSQDEALDLLREEHERGHVHTAWFKDALLDRFFTICNCCKCCCGGIEAMTKYGFPALAASGYVSQVDNNLCTACGICVGTCPFDAIQPDDAGVLSEWQKCMGCGVCVEQCPFGAMSLVRDERKGLPLDVRLLGSDQG